MPNRVAHFEIQSNDPEKTIAFYKEIFGWEFQKWEGGQFEYWMIMTAPPEDTKEQGINGGLLRRPCPAPKPEQGTNAYVCTIVVDNFDNYAEKIIAAGGIVALPKMALTGMAWQGYFIDPDGNTFGLHQPDKNAK
ncbi:MAG: hypothetical protein A2821_03395 [Candidatus Magasanikbacteria bacterium RIFCSPHIGHO2_01_FULL_41_23]|uniref:VOC domain-containing protein n=1 Tax=Candidatus Magasanikbacteria bacterium RIFCSPLOWO2_01_FULL_40_15 TaxID=1798686 RepID=A0A1F6N3S5_9BACT|nr:MAG: hypothetical protein A2821_03395 [Candidatus Magasanikbacteria bacterium RIFCSPHIGHO2_01_FULL_41_23]OGH76705.1 MAG: hypothetical protein A3F22_03880 [Candidatus Magasanikbacteria bacterium RIFCSPHIGHO2_12_FULL_41_16]OGH78645.1 MAG: hypothetical protein A2983_04780 [Candidatus Magasanikbacteria bacterium RIFCSPLOWO2_01_FULL_40_15]